ncbi:MULTISPECIES: hypothetical protein [Bifidobacterium]|nr:MULTISPECIES: hypothetical protein [Bifidobacterium]TPF77755.1 hypothetical protein BW09_07940 [Bifidobacterium sp. UTCIF-1]TPF80242.1 hypothetical protein BW08_05645 [Bifidobacterium sp. UTCIF-24]TPF83064.1 hypothetical protein BW12_01745 [Bifidobacterium sp. UTCIF-3]TPF84200.1 hypothetical protein BW07_05980 [Bifidobacterium sp. UTCIF-36]TPF90732.1 hypothetical protein BW10_02425 [Bifidobacterium sp. UTBIF-56]
MSTRPAYPDSSNSSAAAAAAHASAHGGSGLGPGFGSLRAAGAAFGPVRMGASRPSRPAQLDPAVADGLAGGMDPQAISEMSHLSAAALLDRVRHSEDPEVVQRVLTLVETVGVDEIAELWSDAEPDSLPGVLWRLYMLRTWMRSNRDSIARLWRLGEPVATTASAIAGVDQAPTEDDIVRLADSILSGAFVGDFAVALERAAAFTDVVALGLRVEARRRVQRATANGGSAPEAEQAARAQAAKLLHTGANLMSTARTFEHGAHLWRRGRLE